MLIVLYKEQKCNVKATTLCIYVCVSEATLDDL